MDEWVGSERIALEEGPIEEAPKEDNLLDSLNGRERTVTRNIKRRHDEINHIQKVREREMINNYLFTTSFFLFFSSVPIPSTTPPPSLPLSDI